jgi:hypothetical protein
VSRNHLGGITASSAKLEGPPFAYSWKDIAGAGNVYRHDYEEISTDMLWNTVKALLNLLEVVEQELSLARSKPAKHKPSR